jgi:protein involved in polysaccharide export with SLBB domain
MSISNVGKRLGRWSAVCGLVLTAFWVSGCRAPSPEQQFAALPPGWTAQSDAGAGSASAPAPAPKPTKAPAPAASPVAASAPRPLPGLAAAGVTGLEPAVFRAGDSLTIVYGDLPAPAPPNFEGKVKEDGTITLLLNQTFTVAGKTVGQLEKEIRDCYVPKYYKYMTATVKPVESTQWYYVNGEVRAPSRQIYNSRMTVLKAIASAGGFTDFAKKTKVQLTRVDGRTLKIDCNKALKNPALDLEIYPGDTIHVPRRFW